MRDAIYILLYSSSSLGMKKEGSNLNMLGMAELGKGCSKHVDTVVDQGGFWNENLFFLVA